MNEENTFVNYKYQVKIYYAIHAGYRWKSKCMEKCEQTLYRNTKYARQTRLTIILNMQIYGVQCTVHQYESQWKLFNAS